MTPKIENRIYNDGTQEWYSNELLHNTAGPASTYAGGHQEWWIMGDQYSFNAYIKQLSISEEDAIILKLKYGG